MTADKKVIAIIPARGGSKRLPRKNIYEIWGKPMLYWAIKACQGSKYKIEPWVSTEDEEIEKVAQSFGAKIHKRDPRLSEDHVYKQEAIRAAAKYISEQSPEEPDIVISLQANSPEIKSGMLDNAIEKFLRYDRNELFSVDFELIQNAAFRIMKYDYVYQKDLSTKCGVYMCSLRDVHTIEDIEYLEERRKKNAKST